VGSSPERRHAADEAHPERLDELVAGGKAARLTRRVPSQARMQAHHTFRPTSATNVPNRHDCETSQLMR
jgi:hypothetical protein